jgi:serine/threonine protein kinase
LGGGLVGEVLRVHFVDQNGEVKYGAIKTKHERNDIKSLRLDEIENNFALGKGEYRNRPNLTQKPFKGHPNIIQVIGETANGLPIFESPAGSRSLSKIKPGEIPLEDFRRLMTDLENTVHDFHKMGLAVVDISANNILAFQDGQGKWQIKLIDLSPAEAEGTEYASKHHPRSVVLPQEVYNDPRSKTPDGLIRETVLDVETMRAVIAGLESNLYPDLVPNQRFQLFTNSDNTAPGSSGNVQPANLPGVDVEAATELPPS